METKSEEVKKWVDLLRSKAAEDLLHATESGRIGVRTRGAVRVRGSVMPTAQHHVPKVFDALNPVLEAFFEQKKDVRREVVCALGERGDELSIEVLGRIALNEAEWRIRVEIIDVLEKIGGFKVVNILKELARTDPDEEVRARAIHGLGELALKTWKDKLGPAPPITRGEARIPYRVRVRGASPSKSISPEADAILSLLDEIRNQDWSPHVRRTADKTLASLESKSFALPYSWPYKWLALPLHPQNPYWLQSDRFRQNSRPLLLDLPLIPTQN
ncbi:MAG: HEAT repeat domain-containing protein [Methanosarcinales archaeon]